MQIKIASMHTMTHSDEQIKAFTLINVPLACMLNDIPIMAISAKGGPGMHIPERSPLAIGWVVVTKASIQYQSSRVMTSDSILNST